MILKTLILLCYLADNASNQHSDTTTLQALSDNFLKSKILLLITIKNNKKPTIKNLKIIRNQHKFSEKIKTQNQSDYGVNQDYDTIAPEASLDNFSTGEFLL